jgi:hypothetical protein
MRYLVMSGMEISVSKGLAFYKEEERARPSGHNRTTGY